MSKYIDAEKLKAEIKRQKHELELSIQSQGDYGQSCHIVAYDNIISIITSLQEEQPEVDLVAELKHHLATTPKEQLEKEWKELEPWGNIGPTVQEFLYGKQPEVDLEKEAERIPKPELTIQDVELLHTFLYAVKNNKHGVFTFTRLSDEQYQEVLNRFNKSKERKK